MSVIKPKIVVSQCLEFDECRYNGQMIPDRFVRQLRKHVEFLPICPEVAIGLGVPRDPIKLVKKNDKMQLVQPSTGKDLTNKMEKFSKSYLKNLKDVDGFILKFGSPSCGTQNVKLYHSMDNPHSTGRGAGMFAGAVLEKFGNLAVEDEGRLSNFKIREHFLIKLYAFARFRSVKRANLAKKLIEYHTRHKLIFMAYNQTKMKELGRIAADIRKRSAEGVINQYEKVLWELFKKVARYTSHINVLMHTLGYFKNELLSREKKYFLDSLEKYRKEQLPLSAVTSIVRSWIIKYDEKYLSDQIYFEPFPDELVEISDSGKGRSKRY